MLHFFSSLTNFNYIIDKFFVIFRLLLFHMGVLFLKEKVNFKCPKEKLLFIEEKPNEHDGSNKISNVS